MKTFSHFPPRKFLRNFLKRRVFKRGGKDLKRKCQINGDLKQTMSLIGIKLENLFIILTGHAWRLFWKTEDEHSFKEFTLKLLYTFYKKWQNFEEFQFWLYLPSSALPFLKTFCAKTSSYAQGKGRQIPFFRDFNMDFSTLLELLPFCPLGSPLHRHLLRTLSESRAFQIENLYQFFSLSLSLFSLKTFMIRNAQTKSRKIKILKINYREREMVKNIHFG